MNIFYIQSFIVYTILFIIMFILFKQYNHKYRYVLYFIAILIYAVCFGCRYGVGFDHLYYLKNYQNLQMLKDQVASDYGFYSLMQLCKGMNLHYAFFFSLIAFLQLFFVFYSLKKFQNVYSYVVFTFMIGCVWLSFNNGLRQELAFTIFALGVASIANRNLLRYCILIACASLMHKSAILLFPLYFLYSTSRNGWFKNVKWQLILVAIAFVLGINMTSIDFMKQLESVLAYFHYDVYLSDEMSGYSIQGYSFGLGSLILLLIDILIVVYSNYCKGYYSSTQLNIMYDCYFVGLLIKCAFINSPLVQRVNYYFYGFQFIVAAFILGYLVNTKNNNRYVFIGLYILVFLATLLRMEENTSLFKFFWQIPSLY